MPSTIEFGLDKVNSGSAAAPPSNSPEPGPRSVPLSKLDVTIAPRACSVNGCIRPASRKDLCDAHYRRLLAIGDVGGPDVRGYGRRTCSVAGCERPHKGRGYCAAHLKRVVRYGDPGLAEIKAASPPVTVPGDPVTLAYVAGLMDGEGTITRKAGYGYWCVQVTMMDEEIIEYLASSIGGTVSSHHRATRERREHIWTVSRQSDVFRFIVAILPYLRVNAKRSKAMQAIDEIAANPTVMEALND